MSTSGPCTDFPAPGLRVPNRYISGHNEEGEAIFLQVSTKATENDSKGRNLMVCKKYRPTMVTTVLP
jgi:hypothetical protein